MVGAHLSMVRDVDCPSFRQEIVEGICSNIFELRLSVFWLANDKPTQNANAESRGVCFDLACVDFGYGLACVGFGCHLLCGACGWGSSFGACRMENLRES